MEHSYWQAVLDHDRSFDGRFFYGVLSTGVYCRPSCPGRRPLRRNVKFYTNPQQAEGDGLRACLRCHPLALTGADPNAERIAALCRFIETRVSSDQAPTLAELSREAALSPFHLQRSFKAITGVTPRQYADACRLNTFKNSLRKDGQSITRSMVDAGYGSASRLYEKSDSQLGMTPGAYRRGGAGVHIRFTTASTPVGPMLLAASDRGVCSIQFGGDPERLLESEFPQALLERTDAEPLAGWAAEVASYLEGKRPSLDLPLDIQATAFQRIVWEYLQTIPRGETRSYRQVAQDIGRPKAARAVANACASNRLAIAIPCHRVVREDGGPSGYRWGMDRKRAILESESD
ncbi:MAG TPA: bifunctional DNA-binding transcriptional regulator/O6-methylguanine-DNA methyltransferase Ada [Bryobacteraceae bacterium]|jgi:AraC family transcriptional regulator of adaptative response/methylated-DNA-[protein]-cysteine methyltransferase